MCLHSDLYKLIIKTRIKNLAERLYVFLTRFPFFLLHMYIECSLLAVCYVKTTNTVREGKVKQDKPDI